MRYVLLKALAICVLTVSSLNAASIIQLEDEQIIDRADYVIYGYVADIETFLEEGNTPYQYISILVEKIYKNDRTMPLFQNDQLMIRQIGGEVGGIVLDIDALPSFRSDTNVFLSLKQDTNGYFYVVGNEQGLYHMEEDGMLVRDTEDDNTMYISFTEAGSLELNRGRKTAISLEEMESKVEKVMRRRN